MTAIKVTSGVTFGTNPLMFLRPPSGQSLIETRFTPHVSGFIFGIRVGYSRPFYSSPESLRAPRAWASFFEPASFAASRASNLPGAFRRLRRDRSARDRLEAIRCLGNLWKNSEFPPQFIISLKACPPRADSGSVRRPGSARMPLARTQPNRMKGTK